MKFFIQVKNDIGTFDGEIFDKSFKEYEALKANLLAVYNDQVFEMELQDESYLVIPFDIIKKSIFLLKVINP